MNKTIEQIEDKESNTMNVIETLNQDVAHLKIVTKMINIDSCTAMARNGIVTSGYYDLDLGSLGSPTTGFCHLPKGKFFSTHCYFTKLNLKEMGPL